MTTQPQLIVNTEIPPSLARTRPPERPPLRLGLVQERWHADPDEHRDALATGIRMAVGEGARIVCLQELTLSRYFATTPEGPHPGGAEPEDLESGPTVSFAAEMAIETGAYVHASLFERAADGSAGSGGSDSRGFNTAVIVAPDGRLVQRTRKLHIPITAGYYEDKYFRQGPASEAGDPFPLIPLPLRAGAGEDAAGEDASGEDAAGEDAAGEDAGGPGAADQPVAQLGAPTCWDQWFPELARAYSLAGGEVLIYPTAIGSEPDHPDFDTQPLWQQVIVGNGVANGTFMVAVNRIGVEEPLEFYGSSFISDPYGRILVQAPRSEPAVLVADLDLDQRRDWLELFPFLTTRRPDAYGTLVT